MSSPITGFTAIPNPQMLAFMPIQSYLMMYFAGAGWQIGKRKISAIPNPEFNKMSANDLLKGFTADLRETIPTLISSMNDVTPLIEVLIKQYGDFIKAAIQAAPQAVQTIAGALVNPKGALVPPAFGPELEKLITGNPTQAQFLAYAKILLQQEADKLSDPNRDPSKFRSPTGPNAKPGATVRGDEQPTNLVPYKGKWYTLERLQQLIKAQAAAAERLTQRAVVPAPHIIDRSRSNVSLQSLRIEKSRLEANVRNTLKTRAQLLRNRSLQGQRRINEIKRINISVNIARQQLANFNKMHGKRF